MVLDGRGPDELAALPVEPGAVVDGKYRVDRYIGHGGMGVVFAATHLLLDQRVALKLPLTNLRAERRALERYVQEARSAFRLSHPNVVRVLDLQISDSGLPYIVMEYLEGRTLAEAIAEGRPLPLGQVLRIAIEAAQGVAAVHRAKMVHRDLKPSNIFLARAADEVTVKILDLGIAKAQAEVFADAAESRMTGSPPYMSPEQLQPGAAIDHRADIWSLGIVIFEMATGERPFFGATSAELQSRILVDPPTRLPAGDESRDALNAIVMRCLAKDPTERYADADALRDALVDLNERISDGAAGQKIDRMRAAREEPLESGTTTSLPSEPGRYRPRASRGPIVLAVGAASLIVIAGSRVVSNEGPPPGDTKGAVESPSWGTWKPDDSRFLVPAITSAEPPRRAVAPPEHATATVKKKSTSVPRKPAPVQPSDDVALATDTRL